jgi:PAS domain S-box-containing protein
MSEAETQIERRIPGTAWDRTAARDLLLGMAAIAATHLAVELTGGLPNPLVHLDYVVLMILAMRLPPAGAFFGAAFATMLMGADYAYHGESEQWVVRPVVFFAVTGVAVRLHSLLLEKAALDREDVRAEQQRSRRRVEEALEETQTALQEREERYRRLVEFSPQPIGVHSGGRVVFMNPAGARLFGATGPEELIGMPVLDLVHPDSRPLAAARVREVYGGSPSVEPAEEQLLRLDGQVIDAEVAAIPITYDGQAAAQVVIRDITERKRTAEELRRLTARLLEVQEEERRQVAYDIHDGIGQLLTAASMHVESFYARRGPAAPADAETELGKAKRCLADAVVEMRRMVSELGPLQLEEMGLVGASRRLLSDMAERSGWQTEFEDTTDGARLDGMVETALFRIVQEALSNVAKHSGAQRVRVSFACAEDCLRIGVRDWGCGFDPGAMPDKPTAGRNVGLVGMRERAALIGAQLRVESAPGKGTSVSAVVPIVIRAGGSSNGRSSEVITVNEGKKEKRAPDQTTILIADDHPMVREGLRSMLDGTEGLVVVGEAADGHEAVDAVETLAPDVVLMDVRMPDMDGLAATEAIKQNHPETSIVIITSYESKDYLRRAIEAGAAGYLLKGMSRDSLIDAIGLVKGGGSLIDARLLSEMLAEMGVEGSRFHGEAGTLEALTPRELDVLQLLVGGMTNKEIAAEMHYSVGTVKNVVQRVIEKLGVSDRTQAAVYAVRAGLQPPAV